MAALGRRKSAPASSGNDVFSRLMPLALLLLKKIGQTRIQSRGKGIK
jgi:hypothetical protein